MHIFGLFVMTSLAGFGCGKKQSSSFGKSGETVQVEWTTETEFQPAGQRYGQGGRGEIMLSGTSYGVALDGFPVGSRWQVGAKQGVLEAVERDFVAVAEVSDQLGKLELANPDLELAKIKVDGTLVLDIKGGGRMDIPLREAPVGKEARELMAGVAKGLPVAFTGEPADVGAPDNVVLLNAWKVLGTARLLQDVDAVATTRWLPEVKGKTSCIGYVGNDTGSASKWFPLEFVDTEVVIYARRTGKVLETKLLPATEECPEEVRRKPDDAPEQRSASPAAIEAFVEGWLVSQAGR